MRSEIDLNEFEIDPIKCEHFLKANLVRGFGIDPIRMDLKCE